MNNGILPLNEDTLIMLEQKHPEAKEAIDEVILTEPLQRIHPIIYDVIDEDIVLKAVTVTKGGSGPSGLDGDGWRRILCSTAFGTTNTDLRKAIAEIIKKLCILDLSLDGMNSTSIEAFTACRMKPLNKKPGLHPIGVGEDIMRVAKEHVINSVGSLQVCAGQNAGAEAAIHAMHDIYENNDTEAILLFDA